MRQNVLKIVKKEGTVSQVMALSIPTKRSPWAWLAFLVVLGIYGVHASSPDCGGICHNLAYCVQEANEAPHCSCMPGTIDRSGGNGSSCEKNGISIRYVREMSVLDPGTEGEYGNNDLADFCSNADGVYVRAIDSVVDGRVRRHSKDVLEVNCLYSAKPTGAEMAAYSNTPRLCLSMPNGRSRCRTEPTLYTWTLPTTEAPIQVPPTGLIVQSVFFQPLCAESQSGCWVIKGTMTTGEAWNTFQAFNTFFLPQADITSDYPTGDISFDYNYDAVDWTFQPASHPCTSANYQAGVTSNNQISSCCIDYPGVGDGGGFIPNYRPTEAFVDWAGALTCDDKFTNEQGNEVCWKYYPTESTWQTANLRCKAAGGYLATIASEAENAKLLTLIRQNRRAEGAWIGLTDDKNESVWEWVDGSPLDYTNWEPGNPEDGDVQCWTDDYFDDEDYPSAYYYFYYRCDPENYAWIRSDDGLWRSQQNNDGRADWNPFVCEFDPPSTCISHVIQRPDYSAPNRNPVTCWEGHAEEVMWAEAQGRCAEVGGSLVTLDNLEEHFFFRRVMREVGAARAWIGLNDMADEGIRTWASDGSELDVDYWGPALYENFHDDYSAHYYRYYEWNYTSSEWYLDEEYERGSLDEPYRYFEANADILDCYYYNRVEAAWVPASCAEEYAYVCEVPRVNATVCHSDAVKAQDDAFDIPFPVQYDTFLDVGKFKGMPVSPGVVDFTNLDPFFGQFSFRIHLDEVELRTKAGKLRGTVGVEHTVDTFLGLANFRPTGMKALDTFATQASIHLEKTSFFSVSTHGTNDYTFLEYVNMRLVMVLPEDADFSDETPSEAADRTVRTNRAGNAAYLQVTFTLGTQYQPNMQSGGLIPLSSVRAGTGTFLDDVEAAGGMEHVCGMYQAATTPTAQIGLTGHQGEVKAFDDLVDQECGPQSSMCASPSAVPDQFVSFNVPLGFEVFDDQASDTLSSNLFVSMVINAVDTDAPDANAGDPTLPNDGGDAFQVKTTLTGTIPIVEGGINIFCDGFTAKTDLKDVANVDIVVGTASDCDEFFRLRVLEDVASSDLAERKPSQIDTDSIEAALMTLVIKGNHDYFLGPDRNTLDFTVELDDVITLHLMEDGQALSSAEPEDGSIEGEVIRLLAAAGADNSDSAGLDTDGYALNGAFFFTIDRAAGTASLEPSEALLAVCPLSPPRPLQDNVALETCVLRRDVRGRDYPARVGAQSTAMEILAAPVPKDSTQLATSNIAKGTIDTSSEESAFMSTVLGDNAFAKQLAVDFVKAIHCKYVLNGRYRRAYWINPGYEWTPTQTAGRSIFSVSQKLYMFALVSLDENWGRRRMLLQSSTDVLSEQSAGMNQAALAFDTTPKSMLASAFGVTADRVALFSVEARLTAEEACMPLPALQDTLRQAFAAHAATLASGHHTVQVLRVRVDKGDETCGRRSLRQRRAASQLSTASASVQMAIVFEAGTVATFNRDQFAQQPGITSVVADADNSPRISLDGSYWCTENCAEAVGDSDSSGGGLNLAMVAGLCGGVVALVLMVVGYIVYKRQRIPEPVSAVHLADMQDVKSRLQADVSFGSGGRNRLGGD